MRTGFRAQRMGHRRQVPSRIVVPLLLNRQNAPQGLGIDGRGGGQLFDQRLGLLLPQAGAGQCQQRQLRQVLRWSRLLAPGGYAAGELFQENLVQRLGPQGSLAAEQPRGQRIPPTPT